ncbi:efflux RND transporter periplasmic adaptor subunit [uncultured Acinetobacter sp.]|uniref:efflux RND transporter periplasmic adaptor subunit n=1 Tax=uncultured Acinetobacter sp. TaxID=165433 RepID=UPI0025900046|nr:efflux RND transporter periplasmic adaptor subunit [uncultured Acinetobacter sp.]
MLTKKSQWFWVVLVLIISLVVAGMLLFSGKKSSAMNGGEAEHAHAHAHAHAEAQEAKTEESGHEAHQEKATEAHQEEQPELIFTAQQLQQFGIVTDRVRLGEIQQQTRHPAKLVVNTDAQAHVGASFMAQVEQVNVSLGQSVKKGQVLATLFVPELIDQQANLSLAREALNLAAQDYQREKQLMNQGVSARQDYQRAYNAYRQAQIQVQAATHRLSAYGVSAGSQGRYAVRAPLSGTISSKDIVVGEQVATGKPLFVIDQLDQLWLEFILPNSSTVAMQPGQKIKFVSLQTQHEFEAQIQSLTAQADQDTGRLQVRGKVLTAAKELRPNLMVNVLLETPHAAPVLRVDKRAVQQREGQSVVFVVFQDKKGLRFEPKPVKTGRYSSDGAWVEIVSGLTQQQQYVREGSFVLKSELEKGEAEHGH